MAQVAIKCKIAAIGYFVGLGICSDWLILGRLFVSVKKIAVNGKNLHFDWQLCDFCAIMRMLVCKIEWLA